MKIHALFVLLTVMGCSSAPRSTPRHDSVEANYAPGYLELATGALRVSSRAPWPFEPSSIGHTMASYQNYGDSPYFHHGIDIRGDAGTPVLLSKGGKVVNIANYGGGVDLYWELAVLDDDGFLWQYHHIDRDTIPEAMFDALRTRAAVPAGTEIGKVIYWWEAESFGERYNHIHVNVIGASQRYVNGFAFLEPLGDTQAPEIREIALTKSGRRVEGNEVSGDYSLMANVADLIRHEQYIVPAYSLTAAIDGGAAETVWRFDELPGGASNARYISNYFVPSETCGDYDCRKLVVNLGFVPGGARAFPRTAGAHAVRVVATDFEGNEASATYSWTVR